MWYKKEEQGRRVSWFYVCNSLTQIFGGLVAYGVSFTHGKFASWRIFYIAIGALTMVIGLVVCIFLPDSPVKARRFTDAEKVAALLRVKGNQRYDPENPLKSSNEVSGANRSQWNSKLSPKERPGVRNLQRRPRLARLPCDLAQLHT